MKLARHPSRLPPVGELYALYARMVLRRIRRFYHEQEAEEVLQEVFERVLRSGKSFRGESRVSTWLYRVTTRHCLIRLRDDRRRAELFEAHGPPAWSRPVAAADQEHITFVRQLWRQVDEELALVGMYYYIDGMSQADIGTLLGCTGRTVSNRLAELRRQALASVETHNADGGGR